MIQLYFHERGQPYFLLFRIFWRKYTFQLTLSALIITKGLQSPFLLSGAFRRTSDSSRAGSERFSAYNTNRTLLFSFFPPFFAYSPVIFFVSFPLVRSYSFLDRFFSTIRAIFLQARFNHILLTALLTIVDAAKWTGRFVFFALPIMLSPYLILTGRTVFASGVAEKMCPASYTYSITNRAIFSALFGAFWTKVGFLFVRHENFTTALTDKLTDMGWVLLHNPSMGTAFVTSSDKKLMTKRQKETSTAKRKSFWNDFEIY